MAVFRSLLVPLKAVVMNLISIGASFGLVVAIFQWGWMKDLVGIGEGGPIEPFVPMMMFAIVFGLSMDYEVFLLSRIKEEYDRTGDNARAVADGLATTARVITAAAAIMVVVFAAFLLEDDRVIKLFGVGLASAVFLDATVVRMLLVPATMELLGDRNWWLPRWLDRILPRIEVEGTGDDTSRRSRRPRRSVLAEVRREPVSVGLERFRRLPALATRAGRATIARWSRPARRAPASVAAAVGEGVRRRRARRAGGLRRQRLPRPAQVLRLPAVQRVEHLERRHRPGDMGRRAAAHRRRLGRLRWNTLVDMPALRVLAAPPRVYGVGATIAFLDDALDWVATHTPADHETRYLEATVTYYQNTRGPKVTVLRSVERASDRDAGSIAPSSSGAACGRSPCCASRSGRSRWSTCARSSRDACAGAPTTTTSGSRSSPWLPALPDRLWFAMLWVGAAAAVLMTVGLWTRLATVTTFAVVAVNLLVSQTHFRHNRAFLAILLGGLALLPAGRVLSVDAWRRRRRACRSPTSCRCGRCGCSAPRSVWSTWPRDRASWSTPTGSAGSCCGTGWCATSTCSTRHRCRRGRSTCSPRAGSTSSSARRPCHRAVHRRRPLVRPHPPCRDLGRHRLPPRHRDQRQRPGVQLRRDRRPRDLGHAVDPRPDRRARRDPTGPHRRHARAGRRLVRPLPGRRDWPGGIAHHRRRS